MYKSIRLHRRSEYDQFILMKAIEEYCDSWCYEIDYCEDVHALDSEFLMIDFESYRKMWQGQFLRCFDQGCVAFAADSGTGCQYELYNKIIPDDGSFTIMQYSNVMDPICLGVAPDLPSAIYYAITNLGHYIRNWKYKMMEVWA